MAHSIRSIGEFGLIDQFRRSLRRSKNVIKGIGDDTAVLTLNKTTVQLWTTDMLVEGVHFKRSDTARLIGRKAMAVNISDIAAMGGTPVAALVSAGLPKTLPLTFVRQMWSGMTTIASRFGVAIVGGDTVRSPKIVISVAMSGTAKKTSVFYRSGAKPGDAILVSGPLGNSFKTRHHLTFEPRLKLSRYLSARYRVHAMIDVSDGLASDLGHICRESGAGARIERPAIPLRRGATVVDALNDGEDFELLFTMGPKEAARLIKDKACPNRPKIIGHVTKDRLMVLADAKGQTTPIPAGKSHHF